MKKLVLGKYLPFDSLIHRFDPRSKLIVLFLLMISTFLPAGWYAYFYLAFFLLLGIYLAKLNLKFVLAAFKPLFFMLAMLLIINIFSIKTGFKLLELSFITIYSGAILDTLYIVVRLFLMILLTTLLTATTKPLDLTLGLEYLMKPLCRLKVPAHEIAMMISIALRYIPTILDETLRIMNAQKSRGVDFEEGKIKEKIMALLSLIVPLFSVAFQRADDLANAMEARCYVPGKERTRYKELKYAKRDYYFIGWGLFSVLITLVMVFYAL